MRVLDGEHLHSCKSIDNKQNIRHIAQRGLNLHESLGMINEKILTPFLDDLQVSRITATSYLQQLVDAGYLRKAKIGRSNYYINQPLFQQLSESVEQ